MKRMAFVLAVVAMAACKKAEPPASGASVPDTSSQIKSDTSHMMMSDTSKK